MAHIVRHIQHLVEIFALVLDRLQLRSLPHQHRLMLPIRLTSSVISVTVKLTSLVILVTYKINFSSNKLSQQFIPLFEYKN